MSDKYPMALPEGTVLAGQFIIEDVLGQGGFGITYKAKDYKTEQAVAIKEFFPDTLVSRTGTTVMPHTGERETNFKYGMDCFLREAETLSKYVDNENIAKILCYFEENGTAYFAMEFIDGVSFDEYIKQNGGKIPYEDAERILVPIMDALKDVHKDGVVHRDVTPDNIYITSNGVSKLLDFGAARYSIGDKSRSLDVVLKQGFAPKEQYTRHGKQGPYTDVYTLGVCFYKAITGVLPEDSIDRLEVDDVKLPSALGVQIMPSKEAVIMKAMAVQPGSRYQSMEEFKAALLNATEDAKPEPVVIASVEQEEIRKIRCPHCDMLVMDTLLYCKYCGKPLDEGGSESKGTKKKGKGKVIGIIAGIVIAVIAIVGLLFLIKPCLFKGHDFKPATCETPKICSVCNKTEGYPIGHVWEDATCEKAKTCSRCGRTEGEPLGHAWEDATCTKAKTCSVCGATEGEALGHNYVNLVCKTCGEKQDVSKLSKADVKKDIFYVSDWDWGEDEKGTYISMNVCNQYKNRLTSAKYTVKLIATSSKKEIYSGTFNQRIMVNSKSENSMIWRPKYTTSESKASLKITEAVLDFSDGRRLTLDESQITVERK